MRNYYSYSINAGIQCKYEDKDKSLKPVLME